MVIVGIAIDFVHIPIKTAKKIAVYGLVSLVCAFQGLSLFIIDSC